MILHREMANGLNPDLQHFNSLINRKTAVKLPPIASSCSGRPNDRSLYGNSDFAHPNLDSRLHRMEFSSFGLPDNPRDVIETKRNIPKELNEHFSFSRAYTVLPPIGKKFAPSAPLTRRRENTVNIPNAPLSSVRKSKRSTRRPRVKRQTAKDGENVSNSAVDNVGVIKTPPDDSGKEAVESFSIDITDTELHEIGTSVVESQVGSDTPNESEEIHTLNEENPKVHSSYTTISQAITIEDPFNERDAESPFPQFNTVPEHLRLYTDVYPPSPPPNERRERNMVEKTRQLLVEENGFRVEFMEDVSNRRRNATCVEIDDTLKNAVQLLRDLFLRKTMEELCMIW